MRVLRLSHGSSATNTTTKEKIMPGATRARPRRVKGSAPARSVRVEDSIWEKAKSRASYEGVSISHVIVSLLEGYARGLLNLPRVQVTYQSQPTDEPKKPEVVE